MADTSNRRGFLRLMFAEGARNAHRAAGPLAAVVDIGPAPERRPEDKDAPLPTVPARPAQSCVEAAEVDRLIDELGLAGRRADVWALMRTSVRLTPAEHAAGRRSCLFAGAAPPKEAGAPAWNGRPLHMLAQIDLSEIPAVGCVSSALPRDGLLVLMRTLHDAPSGLSPDHVGATSAAVLPGTRGPWRRGALPAGARPIQLSAELTLPRAWAAQVAGLDLSTSEQDGWQILRRDLASRQGVPLLDEAPGSRDEVALHRLCGYPDERLGQMRQVCEAAALGIDLDEQPPYLHARAGKLEAGENRWELLFQFSPDNELGWEWGSPRQRLYVWIDRESLQAADFSRVWGVLQ